MTAPAMTPAIPVNLLTGFLGSGKTTLLNHMLRSPAFADCAVLVNEFGSVGVDHHLIESVQGDVVLLRSGCICCTVRGDLAEAIRGLYEQREAGLIPAFQRMVIETTGLADPTPVLSTLLHDRVIRHHFRVGNVVTTVDAVHASSQLARFPEAWKQVAVADRIVITKTDLVDPASLQALQAQLGSLHAVPQMCSTLASLPCADALLGQDVFDPANKSAEVARWLAPAPLGSQRSLARPHMGGLTSFVLDIQEQVDWNVFGVWLSLLLQAHGDRVLRVKGLLDVAGSDTPVVVHGVQHLVHPPSHLSAWPAGPRRSQLVFITLGLAPGLVENSFKVFQQTLARRPGVPHVADMALET